jgi:hypothetical protein
MSIAQENGRVAVRTPRNDRLLKVALVVLALTGRVDTTVSMSRSHQFHFRALPSVIRHDPADGLHQFIAALIDGGDTTLGTLSPHERAQLHDLYRTGRRTVMD